MKKLYYKLILLIILITVSGSLIYKYYTLQIDLTDNSSVFWIITEKTVEDGMNYQVNLAVEMLKSEHPNVEFKLDILPVDEPERSSYISQIHTQIKNKQGPDLFLLPTNEVLTLDEPKQYTYIQVDPFFSNLELEMRDGTFLDMREFFNKDKSISKSALAIDVIDLCSIEGHQYIMPIRYDAPVIYVFDDIFSDYKIDHKIFSLGFDEWMETVIELQDPVLACGAEYNSITIFSDLIDYDTREVIISEEKLSDYLLCYQTVEELVGQEVAHRSYPTFTSYLHGFWTPFPVQVGKLSHSLYYSVIAECENRTLNMYPLKTVEGDTLAFVTYYAAIASYCKNPELAYEFVSKLLSEDFQWEINRPTPANGQYYGLIESSWPILTKGSVMPLLDNLKNQLSHNNNSIKKQNILQCSVDDSSIPVLHTEYEHIVLPFVLTKRFDSTLSQLNDFSSGNLATDVNISEIANEIICNLHLELTS